MPIYEYKCPICNARFERLQHFDDPPPACCPAGHGGVRKVLSPPLIIFKGSGFYATDHKKNGQGQDSRPPSDVEKLHEKAAS